MPQVALKFRQDIPAVIRAGEEVAVNFRIVSDVVFGRIPNDWHNIVGSRPADYYKGYSEGRFAPFRASVLMLRKVDLLVTEAMLWVYEEKLVQPITVINQTMSLLIQARNWDSFCHVERELSPEDFLLSTLQEELDLQFTCRIT